MQTIEEIVAELTRRWGRMTLADLRCAALQEATGSAFEALRAKDGKRLFLLMCLTARGQILQVEQALDLVDDGQAEDWTTLTLVELLVRTGRAGGFCFEALRDEDGRRIALVLMATEPRSITILESLGSLPS